MSAAAAAASSKTSDKTSDLNVNKPVIEYAAVNKPVTEYLAVAGWSLQVLNAAVNQHIKSGWQPFGGISVTSTGPNGGVAEFVQAMVKY